MSDWVLVALNAELDTEMTMNKILRKILTMFWFKHFLGNFKWYRKWHGGRWERHWIQQCCSDIWFDMRKDKQWPQYRMPCSHGTPIIEDYPYKHGV